MQRLVALSRAPETKAATETKAAADAKAATDATASDDAHAAQQVENLLASQVQCVLATTAEDLTPATFLMAYAASPCLRSVFVATPLQARKAQQMLERPGVSILWDNRTGNLADHGDGLLVTASGHAAVAPRSEHESASARFLARNPNMAGFLASDGVAIFEIRVGRYEVVEGYGRPRQWQPSPTQW